MGDTEVAHIWFMKALERRLDRALEENDWKYTVSAMATYAVIGAALGHLAAGALDGVGLMGLLVDLDRRYGIDVFAAVSWLPIGLQFSGDRLA